MKAEDRFFEAPELEKAIQEISAKVDELRDARVFSVKAVWDTKEKSKHAGTCKRLAGESRVLFGVDYIIVIHRPSYESMTEVGQLSLLVHEINHIKKSAKDDEEPSTRPHAHDFCTIPEHDKFSEGIALDLRGRIASLPTVGRATTMEEFIKSGRSI